jgi:hypothetical protein
MNETPSNSDEPSPPPERSRRHRVSGKAVAAWLVFCLLSTAVLIPMTLKRPHWIQFEIVLGVWWVIWFAVLAHFLYHGLRVTDDHELHQPRKWFSLGGNSTSSGSNGCAGDGCFWTIGDEMALVIVGAIVLVAGIWVLFEIAIPVLLFILYFTVRGMLAKVIWRARLWGD